MNRHAPLSIVISDHGIGVGPEAAVHVKKVICFRLSKETRILYNKGIPSMTEATRILEAIQRGEKHASAELLPLVYDELRQLAAQKLAHERPGQTLQATALVHEAWLRLTASGDSQWDGRGHFFAAAAEAMRRILVENARRKNRLR